MLFGWPIQPDKSHNGSYLSYHFVNSQTQTKCKQRGGHPWLLAFNSFAVQVIKATVTSRP